MREEFCFISNFCLISYHGCESPDARATSNASPIRLVCPFFSEFSVNADTHLEIASLIATVLCLFTGY